MLGFGAVLTAAAMLGVAASDAAWAAPPTEGPTPPVEARAAAVPPRDPLSIDVNDAWIAEPPAGTDVTSAYFTMANLGAEPVAFVGVSCPIAKRATLLTAAEGSPATSVVQRIEIRPTQIVTLMPRGLHVTLEGLQQRLVVGEQVPLVLHFASGGQIRISAQVRPGDGE